MSEPVAVAAVVGVTVAICAAAVLPSVWWVRYSLRRQAVVQRECDQWREAAANATVAARVQPPTSDDERDDEWNAG